MKKSSESLPEGKMKNRIRHLNGAHGTELPRKFQNKKSTVSSDSLGSTDRDNKGRFLRGNKAGMKAEIGKRARYERLPNMGEKQSEFDRIDALVERIKKGLPNTPAAEMALEFLSDGLNFRAQMKLAFRKTAQTIDEAAYTKSGAVIPHGCIEAWTKVSQEARRWAKSIGIDLDKEPEDRTLEDVLKEIATEEKAQ